jgi:hypothetical protein
MAKKDEKRSCFCFQLLRYLAIFNPPFFHAGSTPNNYETNKMSTTMQQQMTRPFTTKEAPVKGYTLKELSALYGVSTKCLRTWLEPHIESIGEKKGRYFTTLQIRIIFEKLGEPG